MHLDMSLLAKSLKLASIDVIKASQLDIESQWYQSSGPVDLFFWCAKKKLVKHQMNIHGQIIEWNEFDGVKTGYVREEDLDQGESIEVIRFDEDPDEWVLQQAREFLEQVTAIDLPIQQQMLQHYEYGKQAKVFNLKAFLRKLIRSFAKKA